MILEFTAEEGRFALEFFRKMVRVWKRRQKEDPQFAGICQHFIDQFQFEAEEMEKLLMRPTKPLARPDYIEWSKTLPKEGCMLCDWQEWQLVLKEYSNWVWVYSCAPYKKWNSMLIPKRHVEYMHDLRPDEWQELTYIMKQMYDIFHTINDGSEYVWLWRTRDDNFDKEGTKKKGKRLSHLHIHFMPEASRFLDPALESDAHDEETFNKMVKAVEDYGTRKTTKWNGVKETQTLMFALFAMKTNRSCLSVILAGHGLQRSLHTVQCTRCTCQNATLKQSKN